MFSFYRTKHGLITFHDWRGDRLEPAHDFLADVHRWDLNVIAFYDGQLIAEVCLVRYHSTDVREIMRRCAGNIIAIDRAERECQRLS